MTAYKFRINGKEYNVTVGHGEGNSLSVNVNGADYKVEVEGAPKASATVTQASPAVQAAPAVVEKTAPSPTSAPASASETSILSPMQGNVVEICANVGDNVAAGQKIVVIESMKMEVEISAPKAGKITAILVAKGDHLEENQSVASLA